MIYKIRSLKRYLFFHLVFLTGLLLLASMNIKAAHVAIERNVEHTVCQQTFLTQFTTLSKTFPDNPIIYVMSDADSFMPHNPMPFQIGGGFILMLSLYPTGHIPPVFLTSRYFLDGSEGYEVSAPLGFGYFTDKAHLYQFLGDHPTYRDQVVGLYWHNTELWLEDITNSLKDSLQ